MMSTSPAGTEAPTRSGRPGGIAVLIAVIALALKLPQAALALALGSAGPDWMPTAGTTPAGVALGLGWMVFGAALMWLRRWIGVLASLWFCIVSAWSGGQLFLAGYELWGGWQVLTAVVALAAGAVAIAAGAFKGSRW